MDPGSDVFWVFHDPGQALYREDVVGAIGLEPMALFENHRNPGAVAALAERFYRGGEGVFATREAEEGSGSVRILEAEPGAATVEAVRRELHRLTVEEKVPPFRIAVLSGGSAEKSDVWKTRTFGNTVLWNEAIDDAGRSRGLPPEKVAEEPDDVVLFESVRRFKGLERDVVVLCELPVEHDRLDELLYVGLTRATTHLTVIAPPQLAARLRGGR